MSANNRTAQVWLKELLSSPRFKLAMLNFEDDPQFMLAILTEIVLETREVTSNLMQRIFAKNFRGTKEFILDMMSNNTDYSGFKSAWSLTPTEMKLYNKDPKFQLSPQERSRCLKVIKNSFMNPKHLPKSYQQKNPEE